MFKAFCELNVGDRFSMIVLPLGEVKLEKIEEVVSLGGSRFNSTIFPGDGKEYFYFVPANELVKVI